MSRQNLVLLVLFLMATWINLYKPFHIDDAYHLKASQWILEHPFRPMSGTIDWSGHLEHFHQGNQPPFFFYCMALWGLCFGFSEVAMHLLLAAFTALSIYYFHRLARLLVPRSALLLTSLLVLGPAFLVNQNVMLDVPLLSMICAMLFHLIRFINQTKVKDVVLSAVWLTIGVLTKYTMLALVPVLLFGILYGGRRFFWAVSIPLIAVVLWSIWNWLEFGGIHLLGRDLGSPSRDLFHILLSWLMTLGAVAPWLWIAFMGRWNKAVIHVVMWFMMILIASFIILTWSGIIDQSISERIMLILFLLNGAAGVLAMFYIWRTCFHDINVDRRKQQILLLSIASVGIFTTLLAPWMATRHLLLVLPMFLLLSGPVLEQLQQSIRVATLMITAILGAALAISDHRFAAFYQSSAQKITKGHDVGQIWFLGSLGWGWYAEKAGMKDLATASDAPKAGDLIALPIAFSAGSVPPDITTEAMGMIKQEIGPLDRFSTRTWLRFYSARFPDLPWTITQAQPERILLLKVE